MGLNSMLDVPRPVALKFSMDGRGKEDGGQLLLALTRRVVSPLTTKTPPLLSESLKALDLAHFVHGSQGQ